MPHGDKELGKEVAGILVGKMLPTEAKRLAGHACGQESNWCLEVKDFAPRHISDVYLAYAIRNGRIDGHRVFAEGRARVRVNLVEQLW
ncbi:MAG: hypothetical protein OXQ90_00520 [Gammaproteobacteria bacterium]|nr:hypothetical protein [Gammaproteobacteria bacterium]